MNTKVTQNGETSPDTLSVSLLDVPSIAHLQLLPISGVYKLCLTLIKINRLSDENTSYMKVDQIDETSSDTLTAYPCDASNYLNLQPSPSSHLSDSCPEPGKLSRMGSPLHCYRVALP